MKTLQNNFTTPEQSKRLLELGVPADSADMILIREKSGDMQFYDYTFEKHALNYDEKYSDWDTFQWKLTHNILPCWSVGRLMEIYLTCALEYHPYDDFYTETPSLHLMAFDKDRLIEEVIEIMSEDEMDFSKLEE